MPFAALTTSGGIRGYDPTWSTAHLRPVGQSAQTNQVENYCGVWKDATWYQCARNVYLFDLSSIAGLHVASAEFAATINYANGGGNALSLVKPSITATPVIADFDLTKWNIGGAVSFIGTGVAAGARATKSIDPSWINAGGVTSIGVIGTADVTDTTPTAINYIYTIAGPGHGTAAYRPTLTVVTDGPAGGAVKKVFHALPIPIGV